MTLDIGLIAVVVGLLIAGAYLYGFYKGQEFERRHPGMISPFGKKKNGNKTR